MKGKVYRILNNFIEENDLKTELLPNDTFKYKAKFKPNETLLLKSGETSFILALTQKEFTIVENKGCDLLISQLKKKLFEAGLTYVHN